MGPPAPFPTNAGDIDKLDKYRAEFKMDLRYFGLPIPKNEEEWKYAERYATLWKVPPPAYARDEAEEREINDYMEREGQDPRRLYARGMTSFSLWFHVTDPQTMAILHGLCVAVAVLFTLGCCTRLTSALTWFASLTVSIASPTVLFRPLIS